MSSAKLSAKEFSHVSKHDGQYVDPVYEADAPKFFDFRNVEQDDSNEANAWFENRENVCPDDFGGELSKVDSCTLVVIQSQSIVVSTEIVPEAENSAGENATSGKCVAADAVPLDVKSKPVFRQFRSQSVDRLKSREPLTIPITPELSTASRARSFSKDNVRDAVDAQPKPFRASPVPKNVLAPGGKQLAKASKAPTKAVSPRFETDRRLACRRSFRSSKPPTPVKPVKPTAAVPFKAKPFPAVVPLAAVHLPPKCHKSPTITRPFRFETDSIHENYQRKRQEKLTLEEKARKRAAEFRATVAQVLDKPPFVPLHEEKRPPLQVEEFAFKTAERAQLWQQFELQLRAKESEKAAALRERRLSEELAAQQFVKELRSNAVHKAQPVKKYKDAEPRAKAEITVPKSPNFKVDERLRERHGSHKKREFT